MGFKHIYSNRHIVNVPITRLWANCKNEPYKTHFLISEFQYYTHLKIPFPVLLKGETFVLWYHNFKVLRNLQIFSVFLSILCKLTNSIALKLGWSSACRDSDKEYEQHWISLCWIGKFQIFLNIVFLFTFYCNTELSFS